MPALCPSLGAAAPQWAPSPGPSRWHASPTAPPRCLGPRAKTQVPRICPPPAQAPAEASSSWARRSSSTGPPPLPPPPSVALAWPPLPQLAPPQAPPSVCPACTGTPRTTNSPDNLWWGVHLSRTPQVPPPPRTNAPPGPRSWGKASPACHPYTAQSGGHWGEGTMRPGMFEPLRLSVELQARTKGWLTMEKNSKSRLGGYEVGLPAWPHTTRG